MPKIGNHTKVSDTPCDRCGSKRKEGKTWIEKVKTDSGEMVLYHSKIICTNKVCQAEFESRILEDKEKRVKIRKIKEENDSKRLAEKEKVAAAKKALAEA